MHAGSVIAGAQDSVVLRGGVIRRWAVVGLLFLAILVNYIDRGNLSIAAVPLMHDFGVSAGRMGALLSAFFWTYSLLQIPAGYAVDRYGLKWTYAGAFVLWSLASAGVGFAGSFAQILLLRLLLGIGEAAAQPASLAFIRRNFAADRQGLPTAIYLSGMSLGPALGAMVGASLLAAVGWRMLFIITGLGACIWILPWVLLVPRDAAHRRMPVAHARSFQWALLLRGRTLWGITVAAFFYSYFWYFCLTWIPSYLVIARKFSFLKMGAFTAAPFFLMGVVSMISARVADRLITRFGRPIFVRKIFVAAGFILGTSILLLVALQSAAGALTSLMLSLTGIGIASANYWALTQAASPAAIVGRVIGYQNTIANVAGICSPVLTGFLVDKTKSFDMAIVIAAVSLLIAAAAFLLLIRQHDVDELNRAYSI